MDDDLKLMLMPQRDSIAKTELEIFIGADRVVRINVDGICTTRIRLADECTLIVRDDLSLLEQAEQEPT